MSEAKELSAADFGEFFKEVHGYGPFPWQEALVTRVLDRGWPALIDVPTGLGKTAVLDVAVFLSALKSEHARRRVFLVVDRRLIVDQAHDEAQKLQQALENPPPGSVCARVQARLAVPGDEAAAVLEVTRMRGGVNWSWLWIERPDRHALVTGTVDQIGSRLLFRGYGVGKRLRPIDAAMVGTDSLIIIDEAHLSDPFFSTLRDALAMDGGSVVRSPLVVAMSASPESGNGEAHGITEADRRHEEAGKRLRAAKSLHTVAVAAAAATARSAVADALAYWAKQLGGPGKVVGVVANTVNMARVVFERLRGEVDDPEGCVLLTGRVRPIDREYLLASWYPRIKSGADRDSGTELYVVATQTIEVGADVDLDGLVTQSASLSALVQRLGRVNRLGARDGARVVVVHADKLADAVYGPACAQTWTWLAGLASPLPHKAGHSERDLGSGRGAAPGVLRDLVSSVPASQRALMLRATPYVPLISRSALDTWARTSPTPHPDVPVAPYLHGIGIGEPTVSVVWRADLRGDDPEGWLPSLHRIPPSPDEAIELPISAARRWLSQLSTSAPSATRQRAYQLSRSDASDLEPQEAGEEGEAEAAPPGAARPRVLRYWGTDNHQAVAAQEIQPDDFVIAPAGWGGCDRYGWYPGSALPVTDVADFIGWRGRRATAIRIDRVLADAVQVFAPDLREQVQDFLLRVKDDIESESVDDRTYQALLKDMIHRHEPRLPHEWVLSKLAQRGHLREFDRDEQDDGVGTRMAGLFATASTSWNEDESPAGTSTTQGRKPLTLVEHQVAVSRRAREFAGNLDLPENLVRAVEWAALHHDEGKRDPRFQVMLHRGDRRRAQVATDLLAKSGMDPADRAALRRAADLSGYPPKMRHEALSARIAQAMLEQKPGDGLDNDLIVHLVAAHHGYARSLLPPIVDPDPQKVLVSVGLDEPAVFDTSETVDWEGPARFSSLCNRYGRWGLALLESIVRLADIWCSARSEACNDHRS